MRATRRLRRTFLKLLFPLALGTAAAGCLGGSVIDPTDEGGPPPGGNNPGGNNPGGNNPGGNNPGGGNPSEQTCEPLIDFFTAKIDTPIFTARCKSCHQAAGAGTFLLGNSAQENLAAAQAQAEKKQGATSLLLLKASGQIAHGGGPAVANGSPPYKDLEYFVARVANGGDCPPRAAQLSDDVLDEGSFDEDAAVDAGSEDLDASEDL